MPYPAIVYNVFIASPSDVRPEREIAREAIYKWNAAHAESEKAVLQPIGWETHSYPEMGERPQEIINRLVIKSDILVAIFWSRLGSPTGVAASGTIEEIEKHHGAKKPTMIYFSTAPVPHDVETKQLEDVRKLQQKYESEGLIKTFENSGDFRTVFTQDLAARMVEYLKVQRPNAEVLSQASGPRSGVQVLSEEARQLLGAACADQGGQILVREDVYGLLIYANGLTFGGQFDRQSRVAWESALTELEDARLIQAANSKRNLFRVTSFGYQAKTAMKAG
jgi:hypothetical protein